jgi:glycosyltransferase involved in cell wall biosynthesis
MSSSTFSPGSQDNNRVVHVPRRFVADEWGGTETVILEISRQQQRAGLRPVIVTSAALARARAEEIGGVPVERHSYCYPFFGLNDAARAAMDKKGGNLLSLPLFTSLLMMRNVRLFHAHALKRLGGEVRTAARLRKKPFVVSLHGGVFDVPAAELESMTAPIQGKREWGKVFGALFGSRRLLEDADHVVCVGQSEMEKAKRELSHDRITYLPNGVDTRRFAEGDGAAFRARHGIGPDAFVVLNISRIDAQKNQRLLVEAFASLAAEQSNAVLVLIGPETQPAYAAEVRATAKRLGVADRVKMLPGLPGSSPEIVNAYHACDAFVLPSRHEPFGIVVLEAWSAGKPVVVSALGGLRTLVDHERTGLKFAPDAPDAAKQLAALLVRLAREPQTRARLGAEGRAEALAQYDWEQINTRLETIYRAAEARAAQSSK